MKAQAHSIGAEISFSCAHYYLQAKWSPAQNLEVFGKCYSEKKFGHGHDYRLVVEMKWANADSDGFLKLRKALSILREELDHRHLNHEIAEFSEQIPTSENLALYCEKRLNEILEMRVSKVVLYETPDIFVEIDHSYL